MKSTVIKYKNRHQHEVIFVTSDSYFSTLFLQKKRQSESSKSHSIYNFSPSNPPFTFTGKEKDAETGFSYFGARYYDSDLSGLFLSVDPMADKYPSLSPYAYCMWNPEKLVDPKGKDVDIIKDDENKIVTIRANFYYNKKEIGNDADTFITGMKNALDSWQNDIKEALTDGSLEAMGFEVNFEFGFFECSNPEGSAKADIVGNWISNDETIPYNIESRVSNCKNLKVDFSRNVFSSIDDNPMFYGDEFCQGTLKHEIGHILGLYDRYKRNNGEYATPIANDLMSVDFPRNNAAEPFKRIWKSAGLHQSGSRTALINIHNREIKK